MAKRFCLTTLWLCALYIITQPLYALEQHEKLWLGLNYEQPLTADKQWLYLLFTQWRFIDKSHPWQNTLLEGAIGYQLFAKQSIWLGYRWTAVNPNNGFFQENRSWQQLSWKLQESDHYILFSRTRFEEIAPGNQSQVALRLRKRLSYEMLQRYFSYLSPFIYDEITFQLNKTDYTTHQFFSENRLFLGFRWHAQKNNFWEIGYINQYIMSTPIYNQNQMNHVLSVNYNIL